MSKGEAYFHLIVFSGLAGVAAVLPFLALRNGFGTGAKRWQFSIGGLLCLTLAAALACWYLFIFLPPRWDGLVYFFRYVME